MQAATYINDGLGKSRNALEAEDTGRYPMTVCAKKLGISSAAFRSGCAAVDYTPTEWHHTGIYARRTDYYDLAELTTQERFWRGAAAKYEAKRALEILNSVGLAPLSAAEDASEHAVELQKCTARVIEFVKKYGAEFVVQNEGKQRLCYNTGMSDMGLFEGYDSESNMRSMHAKREDAEAHMSRWQSRCPDAKLRIVTVLEDMLTGRTASGSMLPLYGRIGGKFATLANIDTIRVELKTALYHTRKNPAPPQQRSTQKNWDALIEKQCASAGVRHYAIEWELRYYPKNKALFDAALTEKKKLVDDRKRQEQQAADKKARAKAKFEARMEKHGLSYCESRKGTTGLAGVGVLIYPDQRDRRVCWFNGDSRTIRSVWREICDKKARYIREEKAQHSQYLRGAIFEPLPKYIRCAAEVKTATGQVWSENEMRWRNCGPIATALWHATAKILNQKPEETLKNAAIKGRSKMTAEQKREAQALLAPTMAEVIVFDPCI